uniref:Uncharacterized protein n=1 Tax=Arundo donax TaxID=35708 RepID=A0A0A9EA48_ARUDO
MGLPKANPHMIPTGPIVVMDHPKGNWDMAVLNGRHMLLTCHITRLVLVCHMAKITMAFLLRNLIWQLVKGRLL